MIGDVAQSDESGSVREAAVAKLVDQDILSRIAQTDAVAAVRLRAVQNLRNPDVLAAIAKQDEDAAVRRAALCGVDDQDILTEIARADADVENRISAVQRLEDETVLGEIALVEQETAVRDAALEKLPAPAKKALLALITGKLFLKAAQAEEEGRINFCGFYTGMPKEEFEVMKTQYGLSESEAIHKGSSMLFSLSAVRKITKGGNSFDELRQAVSSRVGYLTPQSKYGELWGREYWVEWYEYKTIDGVRVIMSDDGNGLGLQIFFGPVIEDD